MWPFDLIPLLTSLTELKALLREHNGLMRESLRAQGQIPRTPATPTLAQNRISTSAISSYTSADVTSVTPERRAELDLLAKEQRQIPWRDRQQINQRPEPQLDLGDPAVTTTAFPTPTPHP